MKNPGAGLIAIVLLAGCATTRDVQQMIEENNRKLAAEQFKPELDRIDTGYAETARTIDQLNARIANMEQLLKSGMDELQAAFSEEKSSAAGRAEQLDSHIRALQSAIDQQIASTRAALEEEKSLSAARAQSISTSVAKAQEELGLVREQINEMRGLYSQQQEEMKSVRALLDAQKDSLLAVFRKQKEDLTGIIADLDRHLERAGLGSELTAPAPVPTE